MRAPPWLVVGLVVLVLGAGGVWWQQSRAASADVERVLVEAERELARSPLDRSALGQLRLRLSQLPGEDPDVRRVRARVVAATGDLAAAWSLLSGPAQAPEAGPEDLELGADIMRRLHALTGSRADARLARSLAERRHELTSDPAALLLAWQCAHRGMEGPEEARLRDLLLQRHPTSVETELVTTWERFFQPEGAEEFPLDRLLRLEERFADVPLELEILTIVALLQTQDEGDLGAAVDRAAALLPQNQAIVDLRYYAAVIAHTRGQIAERDAHVDWLLRNAPEDPRARVFR